jgi:hypothetical protein
LAPATALAVVANATAPLTLAPATAFAVVANATAPVTFAPTIELKPLALPVNTPVLAVILTPVIVPLTPSPVNVPTDVMFG